MKKLKISNKFSLPIDAITQTFAILAKRGVGKTYLASVMAEEMLKNGQQIICLDPVGSMWGLKSEYEIAVFGGDHADVPLEEHSGEIIANAIIEHGFSAIIDLSHFRKGQAIRFMVDFAENLYRKNRNALHIFMDEADAFAPQAKNYGGEENRMLGAIEDIVRRGRKRGIGCTLITQRPAVLNKNVLTQCEVLVALRMVHPKDIDAIEEWVNVHADPKEAKKMIDSLPSLPVGDAWFWSPGWGDFFECVPVRKRETFDSGSTPKPGERALKPKHIAPVDLHKLGQQINATIQQVKDKDPRELQKKLDFAMRDNAALRVLNEELEKRKPIKAKLEQKKIEIIKAKDAKKFVEIAERILSALKPMTEMREIVIPKIDAEVFKQSMQAANKVAMYPGDYSKSASIKKSDVEKSFRKEYPKFKIDADKWRGHTAAIDMEKTYPLGACERAILQVLSQYPKGRTKSQIAIISEYSVKSGGFNNALARLNSAGYIDRCGNGMILINDTGMKLVDHVQELPTGDELIRHWMSKLGKCEGMILQSLSSIYPQVISKENLGNHTGYSATSGGFNNALSRLRTLELIEGSGDAIKLSDDFFNN